MFFGAHGPNLSGFSRYLIKTLVLFLAFSCPTTSESLTSVLTRLTVSKVFSPISKSLILVFSEIIELLGLRDTI